MDNRHCVYLHRRVSDNEPFYIGSGVKGVREFSRSSRSKAWHNFIDGTDFIAEILEEGLSQKQSRLLERKHINETSFNLVNIHNPIIDNLDLDFNLLNKLFTYNESSTTCLTWKDCKSKEFNGKDAGNFVFKNGKKSSGCVRVQGARLRIHRVVWTLFGNTIPEFYVIDHIDNNPHNNKIDNLRCVSSAVNARNRLPISKPSGLPSGINVIGKETQLQIQAHAIVKGKKSTKAFAILKYGKEGALARAIAWRSSILSGLSGEESYSDTHFKCVEGDHSHIAYEGYYKEDCIYPFRKGGEIVSVTVHVVFNGKQRIKSFTIPYYTEQEALEKAIEFRDRGNYCEDDFKINVRVEGFIDNSSIGIFDSVKQAGEMTATATSLISACLTGRRSSTGGRKGNPIRTWKYHSN